MYCEMDTFTDKDRRLLADLQIRERARTQEVVAHIPEGTIVKGEERREIFTFNAEEVGTFHFDVRGIKNAILDNSIYAQVMRAPDIPQDYYEHILNNGGVERERLPSINGEDLDRPGVMVHWPNGYSTLIDGNHRLCRRHQLGMRGFRFLVVDVMDCRRFMCRPGEEKKLFDRLDKGDGTLLASSVHVVKDGEL